MGGGVQLLFLELIKGIKKSVMFTLLTNRIRLSFTLVCIISPTFKKRASSSSSSWKELMNKSIKALKPLTIREQVLLQKRNLASLADHFEPLSSIEQDGKLFKYSDFVFINLGEGAGHYACFFFFDDSYYRIVFTHSHSVKGENSVLVSKDDFVGGGRAQYGTQYEKIEKDDIVKFDIDYPTRNLKNKGSLSDACFYAFEAFKKFKK